MGKIFTRSDGPRVLLMSIRVLVELAESVLLADRAGPGGSPISSSGEKIELALSTFNSINEVLDDYETILPVQAKSTRDAEQEARDLVERELSSRFPSDRSTG